MAYEQTYERVGKLIYGVQRLGGPEYLLALGTDARISPRLAASAMQLAERYQALTALIEEQRTPDDAWLETFLRGVPELLATLADGLGSG
jgi:hypothetical protein